MKSKAAIGSHPIHPMLVPIPIGAFFIALIGDILHTSRPEDPFWYDLSFTCIGIGLLFALVAAVFGAIDYLSLKMSSRAFRLASWHAVLNLSMALCYAASFLLRRHNAALQPGHWPPAFGFALAGFGILGVSGWIGGKLAYEHRIGVLEEPPAPAARERSARAAS
ncbi:MAG: DUF2231 domain-containing protein [Thermoanaerobaculia bacterium]